MVNTLVANHKIPKKIAAEWERLNPVIYDKELIAVETANTGVRFKIGDGVKRYNQLPFVDEALYSVLSTKADKSYVNELIGTVDVSSQIEEHNQAIDAHQELFNDKVDKVEGKGLSSNDFTDELKEKLENINDYIDPESSMSAALPTLEQVKQLLIETDMVLGMSSEEGEILADENGNILII
ncbi:MAG: hypothetical protein KBT27_15290 [Prevotellaceae bacterium]|nr:hypothetical protein [Candidatus Faecinaster equi]